MSLFLESNRQTWCFNDASNIYAVKKKERKKSTIFGTNFRNTVQKDLHAVGMGWSAGHIDPVYLFPVRLSGGALEFLFKGIRGSILLGHYISTCSLLGRDLKWGPYNQ